MRSIARIFIASAFFLAGGAALGWQPDVDIPPGEPSPLFGRPPEEALTPLPSLAPAEREELRERLETLFLWYRAKVYEAQAEHYGITLEELNHRMMMLDGSLPDRRRVNQTIRVSLRPEHDPWLLDTAWGLLQEEPIDWKTLHACTRTLGRTDADYEALAREILKHPIAPGIEAFGQKGAIFGSSLHLLRHWPESAADVLAVIYTLPYQPRDRAIAPVKNDAARPHEEEAWLALRLRRVLYGRDPRKATAILERVEAALAAGAYTLDEEGEERLEVLREEAGRPGSGAR